MNVAANRSRFPRSPTKDLTEIGQRPWVNHKGTSFDVAPIPNTEKVPVSTPSTVFNSGKTPALNLNMSQTVDILNFPIPDQLQYPPFTKDSSFAPLGPNSWSNVPNFADFQL